MGTITIFIFLIQLGTILLVAKLLAILMRYLKQPSIVGEILAGILLGPTILGRFFPDIYNALFYTDSKSLLMIETTAWLGVFFFILSTGFEIDLSIAWREKENSTGAGILGIFIPFIIGLFAGYFLLSAGKTMNVPIFIYASFIGLMISLPALMVSVRMLYDMNLIKTDMGLLIISSLAISELLGWILFAAIEGMFIHGSIDIVYVLRISFQVILFAGIALTIGKILIDKIIKFIKTYIEDPTGMILAFVAVLGFFMGAISEKLHIHALFGFFLAGIISGESSSFSEKNKQAIINIMSAMFVPIFFASIGLKIDFISNLNVQLFIIVLLLDIIGKFLGGYLAARFVNLRKENALIFAVARMPGGSIEIIIGMIGLTMGIINTDLFVSVVLAGITSTIFVSPLLSRLLEKREEISIFEYFVKNIIIKDLFAVTPKDAIKEIFIQLKECKYLRNIEEIEKQVLKREDTMATGIGKGIAIPHARVENIKQPIFFYIRSLKGIEWDSPDGEAVHHIFLILTPKNDIKSQLFILSSLSEVFMNEKVREELLFADEKREVARIIYVNLKDKVYRRKK